MKLFSISVPKVCRKGTKAYTGWRNQWLALHGLPLKVCLRQPPLLNCKRHTQIEPVARVDRSSRVDRYGLNPNKLTRI